jgi:hypothetical protein
MAASLEEKAVEGKAVEETSGAVFDISGPSKPNGGSGSNDKPQEIEPDAWKAYWVRCVISFPPSSSLPLCILHSVSCLRRQIFATTYTRIIRP